MEIERLKAKHDEFAEYTHRLQILNGKLDKIDGNIYEMEAGGIFFGGYISEEDLEKACHEARRIHTEGDAAARMYNVMISELNDRYNPVTKEIPPDVKAIEIVKLKYEKLFTVLKYRMLEFDVLNNPNDKWRKEAKGRYFVTHDYFGEPNDDPEDVTVDNLDELKNEKYMFKRPEPQHDYREPQTEYEKWEDEQFQKEFAELIRKDEEKFGRNV